MSTVGNLFVNVGANTAGLSRGMAEAGKKVEGFASKANGILGSIGQVMPDFGGIAGGLSGMIGKFDALKGMTNVFTEGVRAAKKAQDELTKAIEASKAAEAALATAKGTRRNIGKARASLAKQGIDPNKAAKALAVVDIAPMRANVAKATKVATEAEIKLQMAQAATAAGASALPAMQKATESLTAAKLKQAEAEKVLGAARKRNQQIESTRGKLSAQGIDTKDLTKSLKLDDLGKFTKGVDAAKAAVVEQGNALKVASSGFRAFGLIGTGAALAVGAVAAAAVIATAGMLGFAKGAAQRMDALKDEAVAAGISVEALQRLNFTYQELGVGSGVAMMATMRLGIALDEAVGGSEEAREKFTKLGIDYKQIASMSPDAALEETLSKIRLLGTSGARIGALRDVFGKSGMGLAAAINATNEELAEAKGRAEKLVLPKQMVEDLAATNDSVEAMGNAFENVKTMLGSTFSPVLRDLADEMFVFMTADPQALIGGFQAIALLCAIVYDNVAMVVNAVRVLVNLVQALAGIVLSGLAAAFAAVLKVAQAIVFAVEWLVGSGHSVSEAIGSAASLAWGTAAEAAKSAGDDASEALSSAANAISPDASIAVIKQIGKSWDSAKKDMAQQIDVKIALDEKKVKEVNKTLQSMRDEADKLEFSPSVLMMKGLGASGATNEQMAEAFALESKIKALEVAKEITKDTANLQDQIAKATMNAAEYTRQKAMAEGATTEQADKIAAMQSELTFIEAQKKAFEETASTLEDLRSKVDAIGKSETDLLQTKLSQTSATQDQILEAMRLQQIIDSANVDESVTDHFKKLNDRLAEAQANESALMSQQLSNMGLAGQALQEAVKKSLDINEQIAAAEKAASDRQSVEDTLSDLAERVGDIGKSDLDKVLLRLEKSGATSDELARAATMQQQIDASSASSDDGEKSSSGITDSVSTALGNITLAGSMSSGEAVQNQMLSESVKQTQSLATIAQNTLPSETTSSGASTQTMPSVRGVSRSETELVALMQASVAELREINTNTRAFAGVLS